MAEPRNFQFDAKQRSVGAAASRRRATWIWIAVSLALHGALVLFVLTGAARGGHSELVGAVDVVVVGTPSAGDPNSRSATGESEPQENSQPGELRRSETSPEIRPTEMPAQPEPARAQPNDAQPEPRTRPPEITAPPSADPDAAPLKTAPPTEAAPTEPRPQPTDAAPAPPQPPQTVSAPPMPPRPAPPTEAAPAEPRARPAETARPRAPQTASLPPAPARPVAAREPSVKPSARLGRKEAAPGQTASLGSPTGGDRIGHNDAEQGPGGVNINLHPRFRSPPPPPHYPRQSIERDEEGVVQVRALIDPSGAPQRVVVWQSSGFPLLDEAALKAVQGWRFEPMVRDGRAVVSWVQVPVRFRLN